MKQAMRQARRLTGLLLRNKETLATAESCTGGLIAKLITDIPGSSAAFMGGFVTYTNQVKEQLLGVRAETIALHTEVSLQCAEEMAEGARRVLGTRWGVSTTGYAGPGGGTEEDPVGTVYIAVAGERGTVSFRFSAPQDSTRAQVRAAAARAALEAVEKQIAREGKNE